VQRLKKDRPAPHRSHARGGPLQGGRSVLRRRLAGERGGVAVLVALLLVPVLGFTAIAVDVGAMYADKARLQTAADAAALAVARDCALGACGAMQATAQSMVDANLGDATAAPPVLGSNPTSVTVTGSTPTEHWFAPVLGHDSTRVAATATVAWGAPSAGTAALPLIFSWCEFLAQTGGGIPSTTTERTIVLPKKSDTGCTGPSHMFVPGGFGWLVTDGNRTTCRATTAVGGRFTSETGNNPSQGCDPDDLEALVGRTVLLPIFDEAGGTGSSAWYHVYAYAAFTITDYYFAGQYKGGTPCSGSERCIRGYFTRFVDTTDDFSYGPGAPSLGAWVLRLIR
jgi:Flp pilus assembly protein TadG